MYKPHLINWQLGRKEQKDREETTFLSFQSSGAVKTYKSRFQCTQDLYLILQIGGYISQGLALSHCIALALSLSPFRILVMNLSSSHNYELISLLRLVSSLSVCLSVYLLMCLHHNLPISSCWLSLVILSSTSLSTCLGII